VLVIAQWPAAVPLAVAGVAFVLVGAALGPLVVSGNCPNGDIDIVLRMRSKKDLETDTLPSTCEGCMDKQRILITVKTYPTLSRKYDETVCTAGVREDGSWVRIYPVPFRRLEETEQYRKFDWIECHLKRNSTDPRPETFRPVDENELQPVGHIDTADGWRERRRILLKTSRVYDRLDDLIAERARPFVGNSSNKRTCTHCCACPRASSTPKASKPTSCSSTANPRKKNPGPKKLRGHRR